MKIFVTGGAGFIGSNFIRHVLKAANNHAIINYDKLTYAGNLANLHSIADRPSYRFIKGDICDAAAAEAAMRGCDAIVHFAAESRPLIARNSTLRTTHLNRRVSLADTSSGLLCPLERAPDAGLRSNPSRLAHSTAKMLFSAIHRH